MSGADTPNVCDALLPGTYRNRRDSRRVRLNRDKFIAKATRHFLQDEALVPFVDQTEAGRANYGGS